MRRQLGGDAAACVAAYGNGMCGPGRPGLSSDIVGGGFPCLLAWVVHPNQRKGRRPGQHGCWRPDWCEVWRRKGCMVRQQWLAEAVQEGVVVQRVRCGGAIMAGGGTAAATRHDGGIVEV
jgi:hypothetical protein